MALSNSSLGGFFNVLNDTGTTLTPRVSGDITTLSQYMLLLKITIAPRFLICLGGIIANIINIRTFIRIGLDDSVTIAFFNLAIADLISLFTTFACTVAMVLQGMEMEFGITFELSPFLITVICVVTDRIFKDVTMMTTAYLGVQRSLCVLMPLHFKGMFTRFRTTTILLVIWMHSVISATTHLSQYELKRITLPTTNTSMFIMLFRPSYHMINSVINVMNGIILNVLCMVIVLVCVFILTYELKKSVKFRQVSSNITTTKTTTTTTMTTTDPKSQKTKGSSDQAAEKQDAQKVSSNTREKQAITQVTIVCTIFLITNSPLLITSIVELFIPGLALYQQYHYTLISYFNARLIVESINSAVNFFVYYKFNTKFRQLCFKSQQKK